jgi:MYXO-CTERM domain-containing protein
MGVEKMKRFVLGLGCVIAMVPGVASAALSLAIAPDITVPANAIPTGEQFVDLVFNETAPTANEGLFAYDLYLTRDKPGINLVRAEKPDNWVFTSSGASFQEAGPEFSHKPDLIVVNAIGDLLGANQDIQDGTKAARVFYTIDPGAAPGVYHIGLDPAGTLFVSGDTGEAIPVDISDTGTVTVTPEPGSLALLGVAGLLALRRRRSA